jgi:GNAT superfamily N-acetyltransferase
MRVLRRIDGPRGAYVIRLAAPDEAPVLARHRASMFLDMKEVDERGASVIENASIDHLQALVEAREYFGFLADHQGEVIGGGGVWLRPLLPRPGTLRGSLEAYVLNVYTEPDHRRSGVARAIMQAIIEWSREQGVARVSLHASVEGRPLYRDLGFEPTNEMRINFDRS